MAAEKASAADTVSAQVAGYGVSYAITSILSALLVVWKEANAGVHDFLASITGHHWVTHGLLDVIVFVVLGAILSRGAGLRMSGNAIVATVVGATVISGLIIAGYFI
jgi:hypothetical protein